MSLDSICRTHTITFQAAVVDKDDSAGATRKTWVNVSGLTNLACTIQNASMKEQLLYGQRNLRLTSWVYIPSDIADLIQDNYRITSGSKIYNITGFADEAGRGSLTKIAVYEFSGK